MNLIIQLKITGNYKLGLNNEKQIIDLIDKGKRWRIKRLKIEKLLIKSYQYFPFRKVIKMLMPLLKKNTTNLLGKIIMIMKEININFFGDSICFGQGVSLIHGWVPKLLKTCTVNIQKRELKFQQLIML